MTPHHNIYYIMSTTWHERKKLINKQCINFFYYKSSKKYNEGSKIAETTFRVGDIEKNESAVNKCKEYHHEVRETLSSFLEDIPDTYTDLKYVDLGFEKSQNIYHCRILTLHDFSNTF